MEPWELPDIEDELKTVFADGLTVPAVTVVPNPRPATFVQVLRTGGPRMTFKSDGPILTVTAWAPTRSASTPCRRAPGCPPRCCRRGCWSWSWTAG